MCEISPQLIFGCGWTIVSMPSTSGVCRSTQRLPDSLVGAAESAIATIIEVRQRRVVASWRTEQEQAR